MMMVLMQRGLSLLLLAWRRPMGWMVVRQYGFAGYCCCGVAGYAYAREGAAAAGGSMRIPSFGMPAVASPFRLS
jgi:hypothetical protein